MAMSTLLLVIGCLVVAAAGTTIDTDATIPASSCSDKMLQCSSKEDKEMVTNLTVCIVVADYLDCLNSIKLTTCTKTEVHYIQQRIVDAQSDREKYCKATSISTSSPTVTPDASECYIKAIACTKVDPKDFANSSNPTCRMASTVRQCQMQVALNDCSQDEVAKLDNGVFEKSRQDFIKYCQASTSAVTSTPTVPTVDECYIKAVACTKVNPMDFTKFPDPACRMASTVRQCQTQVALKDCSQDELAKLDKGLFEKSRQDFIKYCQGDKKVTGTTTAKYGCDFQRDQCDLIQSLDETTGHSACSTYPDYIKCLKTTLMLNDCSYDTKKGILKSIDTATTEQQSCNGAVAVSALPLAAAIFLATLLTILMF